MSEVFQPRQSERSLFLEEHKPAVSLLKTRATGLLQKTSLIDVDAFWMHNAQNLLTVESKWHHIGPVPELLSEKPLPGRHIGWNMNVRIEAGLAPLIEIIPTPNADGRPLPEGVHPYGVTYEIDGIITRTLNVPPPADDAAPEVNEDISNEIRGHTWAKAQGLNTLDEKQTKEFITFLTSGMPLGDLSEDTEKFGETLELENALFKAAVEAPVAKLTIETDLISPTNPFAVEKRVFIETERNGRNLSLSVDTTKRDAHTENLKLNWIVERVSHIEYTAGEDAQKENNRTMQKAKDRLKSSKNPTAQEITDIVSLSRSLTAKSDAEKTKAKKAEKLFGFDLPTSEKLTEFDQVLVAVISQVQK